MFSFWQTQEKTRFESVEEFERIRTIINEMREQKNTLESQIPSNECDAMVTLFNKCVSKEKMPPLRYNDEESSITEKKYAVYAAIFSQWDACLADFNAEKTPPDVQSKRLLLLKLHTIICNASLGKSAMLRENRSAVKFVKRGAVAASMVVVATGACIALPSTAVGSVAGGYCGYQLSNTAASHYIRQHYDPDAKSFALIDQCIDTLDAVYQSMAFDLTDEEKQNDLQLVNEHFAKQTPAVLNANN